MRVLGRVERFRDRLQLDVRTLEASDVDPQSLDPDAAPRPRRAAGVPRLPRRPRSPTRASRRPCAAVLAAPRPRRRTRRRPTSTTPTRAGCSSTRSASPRSAARRRSSTRACAPSCCSAAALLHDVGRTLELSRGPPFAATEEGRLLGHVHLGLRAIEADERGAERRRSGPRSSTASPCTTTCAPRAAPRRRCSSTPTSSTPSRRRARSSEPVGCRSDVEAHVEHVAVGDDVGLALEPLQPAAGRLAVRARPRRGPSSRSPRSG